VSSYEKRLRFGKMVMGRFMRGQKRQLGAILSTSDSGRKIETETKVGGRSALGILLRTDSGCGVTRRATVGGNTSSGQAEFNVGRSGAAQGTVCKVTHYFLPKIEWLPDGHRPAPQYKAGM
jgi:hypothetical protein